MDELKSLFGEDGKTALDFDSFSQALATSGMKLVDLEQGGYVAKGKYDKLASDYAKYKTDNDVSKYADYDNIKAELQGYKDKEAKEKLYQTVRAKNVDEKFVKFVASEVSSLVTKDKDFAKALDEYVKDNPQFSTKSQRVFIAGSSVKLDGGNAGQKTTNEIMNNILRGNR